MKGTILHPTDFSPPSRSAFDRALALAREEGSELLLVHVLTTAMPMVGDGYMSPKTFDDLQRSIRAQAQKQLDRLLAKAKASRVRVRGMLYEGVAADAIVRAARAKRTKLIVMGTHGRTGLARLLMGSVAERVIGTAPCPVLTVRGK
ncbi:MAG TPA: universal stress protein [Candidatus Acidoferrum sp.]|nr:universal stress protein [Candidatus Acidoferrum sp.]